MNIQVGERSNLHGYQLKFIYEISEPERIVPSTIGFSLINAAQINLETFYVFQITSDGYK